MFVLSNGGTYADSVIQYNLTTAWDLSTASFSTSFSIASQELAPEGLAFSADGTKMYMIGGSTHNVNEYDLSTAWDVTTASYVQAFYVEFYQITPSGLFFKPDGTQMFTSGTAYDLVFTYSLGVQ